MMYQRLCRMALLAVVAAGAAGTAAAAVQVYTEPFHESPVRGAPDDLLMIGGAGFVDEAQVIYRKLVGSYDLPAHGSVPTGSNATEGTAKVLSVTADRLVVRLPSVVTLGEPYALWVKNEAGTSSSGDWSEGFRINDARPLWFSPDLSYDTGLPALGRYLKVIGRNLEPAPGKYTWVKLEWASGQQGTPPAPLCLLAQDQPDSERYVAEVTLPAMQLGKYNVSVSRHCPSGTPACGSCAQWMPIDPAVQQHTVGVDVPSAEATTFSVAASAYGGCRGTDQVDDALCIAKAIKAAFDNCGGTVHFPAGTWRLANVPGRCSVVTTNSCSQPSPTPCQVDANCPFGQTCLRDDINEGQHGISVPPKVHFSGVGYTPPALPPSKVERTSLWLQAPGLTANVASVFTLLGNNKVANLHFKDTLPIDQQYPCDRHCVGGENDGMYCAIPTDCPGGYCTGYESRFFQLGRIEWWDTPHVISDIRFFNNVFHDMFVAIRDGGNPLRHLLIVKNKFESFALDVVLSGYSSARRTHFTVDDSILAANDFYPGNYFDPDAQHGVMATEIGGSRRLDFSGNVTFGGSSGQSSQDAKGWRAAHFWHMNNNHERALIAENTASCTNQVGDGEFLAFDSNANEPGFYTWRQVQTATADTVRVLGSWFHNGGLVPVPLEDDYYDDHWVQVVDGPGLGQTRRIVGCCCGNGCTPAAGLCGEDCVTNITIKVAPEWDVQPLYNSKITVLRQFWQMYVVDNEVNNDESQCYKTNPIGPRGGQIEAGGMTADSVIEKNLQYDSEGIRLAHGFIPSQVTGQRFQYFNEVRSNEIQGEFSFDDCSPATYCPRRCCTAGGECASYCATECNEDETDVCVTPVVPVQTCGPEAQPCCERDPVNEDCCVTRISRSGIDLEYSSATAGTSPVLGYGTTIADNLIVEADGHRGGGIASAWAAGRSATPYQIVSPLIFGNTIQDVRRDSCPTNPLPPANPYTFSTCNTGEYDYVPFWNDGMGVHLQESYTWDAVLYDNTVTNGCYATPDKGTRTTYATCTGDSCSTIVAQALPECPSTTGCGECGYTSCSTQSSTGYRACQQPDNTVFACPCGQTVHVLNCTCSGSSVCMSSGTKLTCL